MVKRVLVALAAVGGVTLLGAAFVAVYALQGQAAWVTRAQETVRGVVSGQAAPGEPAESEDGQADGEPGSDNLKVFTFKAGAAMDLAADIEQGPGIVIGGLVKDGPAARAGVARGDILLRVDGQAVDDLPGLHEVLAEHAAGDAIELVVQHGDEERTLTAVLDAQGGIGFLGLVPCGLGGGHAVAIARAPFAGGAAVVEVKAESPAEAAGLQEGDLITAVDGTEIDPDTDLAELIAAKAVGDQVTLTVARMRETRREASGDRAEIEVEAEPIEIEVTLGENPDAAGQAWLGIAYGGPHPQGGAFMRRLHEGIGPMFEQFLGPDALPAMPAMPKLPEGVESGLFVANVEAEGPAAKAGIAEGEVIVAIDGQELATPDALIRAIEAAAPGDRVTLRVVSPEGEARELPVTLEARPNAGDGESDAWLGLMLISAAQPTAPGDDENPRDIFLWSDGGEGMPMPGVPMREHLDPMPRAPMVPAIRLEMDTSEA